MGLNTIKGTGNWGGAASDLNNNFASITAEIEKLKAANVKFKGYYTTELTLKAAHPSPTVGDNAWVGAEYPGTVYDVVNGQWHDTTVAPSVATVDLSEYATQDAVSKKFAQVETDLDTISEATGKLIKLNLFDARGFNTTHEINWTIVTDKSTLNVTHNNSFSTGIPSCDLDLSAGDYVLSANFDNSTVKYFSLYKNNQWFRVIEANNIFTIESGNIYKLGFYPESSGNYVVSNIEIYKEPEYNLKQIELNKDEIIQHGIELNKIDLAQKTLEESLSMITELTDIELVDTSDKYINQSGIISAAGSTNYHIIKAQITEGSKYNIYGSTHHSNAVYAWYDESMVLVSLGVLSASGPSFTTISNTDVIAPIGSKFIIVAYNSTSIKASVKAYTTRMRGKWFGKKWACVGDSLTAKSNGTSPIRYYDYVASDTDITPIDMGVSGSGYARMSDSNKAFFQRISSIDTSSDVITIFGSFNDLGAGLIIGEVNDVGTTTIAGCINTTIDNLYAVIPLAKLGIVAPTPWDTTQPSTSGQAYNYCNILKAICERRSIPFLDLWRSSGLRPWDSTFREIAYSRDGGYGTHPDENGHLFLAPKFKSFLETLLM